MKWTEPPGAEAVRTDPISPNIVQSRTPPVGAGQRRAGQRIARDAGADGHRDRDECHEPQAEEDLRGRVAVEQVQATGRGRLVTRGSIGATALHVEQAEESIAETGEATAYHRAGAIVRRAVRRRA